MMTFCTGQLSDAPKNGCPCLRGVLRHSRRIPTPRSLLGDSAGKPFTPGPIPSTVCGFRHACLRSPSSARHEAYTGVILFPRHC